MVWLRGGSCALCVRRRRRYSWLIRLRIEALAGVYLQFSDPMLSEQGDVFCIADETFMEEKGGPIPRLVHSNDEHSRFELVDRNRFYLFHLCRLGLRSAEFLGSAEC